MINVLFVDDEEKVLLGLHRVFRRDKFRMFLAESGLQALSIIEDNDIHVVISDYRMPDLNGVELMEILREEYPDIVRIILTGQSDFHILTEAVNRAQVFRLFTKPYSNVELRAGILDGLGQNTGLV